MPAPHSAPNAPRLEQAAGRSTIILPFAGGLPAVAGARRTIGPTGAAAPPLLLGAKQWFHLIEWAMLLVPPSGDASGGVALNGIGLFASNNGNNILGILDAIALPDPGEHTPSAGLQTLFLGDWDDKWYRSDDFLLAFNPALQWNALQFFVTATNLDGAVHTFTATFQLTYETFNEA